MGEFDDLMSGREPGQTPRTGIALHQPAVNTPEFEVRARRAEAMLKLQASWGADGNDVGFDDDPPEICPGVGTLHDWQIAQVKELSDWYAVREEIARDLGPGATRAQYLAACKAEDEEP